MPGYIIHQPQNRILATVREKIFSLITPVHHDASWLSERSTTTAVHTAISLVYDITVTKQIKHCPAVSHAANGGISLVWRDDSHYLEVVIRPNGEITELYLNLGDSIYGEHVDSNEARISELLSSFWL